MALKWDRVGFLGGAALCLSSMQGCGDEGPDPPEMSMTAGSENGDGGGASADSGGTDSGGTDSGGTDSGGRAGDGGGPAGGSDSGGAGGGGAGPSGGGGAGGDGGGVSSGGQGGSGAGGGGGAQGSGGSSTGGATNSNDDLTYEVIMSTLLDGGDTNGEQARDVAFDSQGNMIVVGGTSSPDFPTTPGAYDETHSGPSSVGLGNGGDYDVFVTKFDPDGNLLWSTFLGNGAYDRAYAVEVGPGDDIFIGGRAGPGYPTTPGAYQETHQGDNRVNAAYGEQDAFVTRLKADGSDIVWSTFVGEPGRGFARDIDVDSQGKVYLAMATVDGMFNPPPTTWGPRTAPDGYDGFYGVLSADGSELLYGNYMGSSSDDSNDGGRGSVRVTDSGDVFFFTFTPNQDFDCISDDRYDSTHNGGLDYVIARFDGGTDLAWCTFLGGDGGDTSETHALAIDADGNPVIATGTSSTNLPTTTGPTTLSGPSDGYIVILQADGKDIVAARYLGGSEEDWIEGVAVTPSGDIIVSGGTASDDLPLGVHPLKSTRENRDGHFFQLSPDLSHIKFGTYVGGSAQDDVRALWVSPTGRIGLVGSTQSTNYPAKNAHQSGSYEGGNAVTATLLSLQ